ncbi:hypothetical protein BX600DRAFT_5457 [Xylariales sp. PMI_506]|nr:hypothetical protein BX600DRAFT_5457 [Xylariales sp. PMI_506]
MPKYWLPLRAHLHSQYLIFFFFRSLASHASPLFSPSGTGIPNPKACSLQSHPPPLYFPRVVEDSRIGVQEVGSAACSGSPARYYRSPLDGRCVTMEKRGEVKSEGE